MTLPITILNATLRGLARLVCRVDAAQLARVPAQGPLILVANHINFLDVPLLYTHLHPRPVTGFAKVETWHDPVMGLLFDLGGAIPIRRGEADVGALRRGLQVLEAGHILAVAPEGTRSGDGRLQRGQPGVVLLALHSRAPLLPVAHYGGERFSRNIARLRRTSFRIVVGQPFHLDPRGAQVTRQVRRQMTDEVMYQLAALLPPGHRGEYANLHAATETFLCFAAPAESNLRRAGDYPAATWERKAS